MSFDLVFKDCVTLRLLLFVLNLQHFALLHLGLKNSLFFVLRKRHLLVMWLVIVWLLSAIVVFFIISLVISLRRRIIGQVDLLLGEILRFNRILINCRICIVFVNAKNEGEKVRNRREVRLALHLGLVNLRNLGQFVEFFLCFLGKFLNVRFLLA